MAWAMSSKPNHRTPSGRARSSSRSDPLAQVKLAGIEHQIGPIPISVRAFFMEVGGVAFNGRLPGWSVPYTDALEVITALDGSDEHLADMHDDPDWQAALPEDERGTVHLELWGTDSTRPTCQEAAHTACYYRMPAPTRPGAPRSPCGPDFVEYREALSRMAVYPAGVEHRATARRLTSRRSPRSWCRFRRDDAAALIELRQRGMPAHRREMTSTRHWTRLFDDVTLRSRISAGVKT